MDCLSDAICVCVCVFMLYGAVRYQFILLVGCVCCVTDLVAFSEYGEFCSKLVDADGVTWKPADSLHCVAGSFEADVGYLTRA